jgi:hypothetical protein
MFGAGVCGATIWLTFFASAGAMQMATLVVAVVVLIWFSTVDPRHLGDASGRPHLMLFGLTTIGGALALTAAVLISTPTIFLVGVVVLAATVVGIVRVLRAAMGPA